MSLDHGPRRQLTALVAWRHRRRGRGAESAELPELEELLHPTEDYRRRLAAWIAAKQPPAYCPSLLERKLLERTVYIADDGWAIVCDGWGTTLREWKPDAAERALLEGFRSGTLSASSTPSA